MSLLADRVLDNETGIVRWVSEIPIEPGEPQIFNFSAKMCDSSRCFPMGCYDSNGGAGLSREAAYRAALGEAVERYCCSIFFPDELVFGSQNEVSRRMRALHPDEVALFHPTQRDKIRYAWFRTETPLCWTPGYSLTRREEILIPACMVFVPYFPFRLREGEMTVAPGISTGQACALARGGAMLGGIYEIVERDAFMIAWLNRLSLPQIVIDTGDQVGPVFRERFDRPNLTYSLFDMTTDIAIPSVACMVVDHSYDPPMVCFGGASNLDPQRAALKALIEAAQTREWAKFMGKRSEPAVVSYDYSDIHDFENHVFLYAYADMEEALSFLNESTRKVSFSDLTDRSSGEVGKDLKLAMGEIELKGYEICGIDLTTPDVLDCGYHVVKMFIPKLQAMEGEHSHRLLGGTRLYEVPTRLGYPIHREITDLNPYPHPYP